MLEHPGESALNIAMFATDPTGRIAPFRFRGLTGRLPVHSHRNYFEKFVHFCLPLANLLPMDRARRVMSQDRCWECHLDSPVEKKKRKFANLKKSKFLRWKRHRPMRIEKLEDRQLLAGDIYHNFTIPEDSDGNGSIDPLDVLVIINQLNGKANSSISTPHRSQQLLDVDGDRALTPLDALVVINHLNLSNGDFSRMMRESRVNSERRIDRIEWSIANDNLPPGMTIDGALNILATLRSGGRPELGDRIVDGLLRNSIETIRIETATARESGEPLDTPAIRESGADLGIDEESIQSGNNRLDSTKPQLRTSANKARTNLLSEQQRDNLTQLRSELEAVIANSGVTSEMIQQLTNDLLVLLDGATIP